MSPILQIKGVTKKYGGLTANNNISFVGTHGHLLYVAQPELNIIIVELLGICPCFFNHFLGKIYTDNFSTITHYRTGNKAIVAGAASKIDNCIAGLYLRKCCWQSATERQVGAFMIAFKFCIIIGHDMIYIITTAG